MAEKLVVYDSYFGNTAKVAEAIAEALGGTVRAVDQVTEADLEGLKILFVGSPTRAFRPTPKAMTFLNELKDQLNGVKGSVFDTRIPIDGTDSGFLRFMIRLFGYADVKLAKAYKKTGADLVLDPAGFAVVDSEGPLAEGELGRTTAWAKKVL
ncbi:nitric oxide synthase [bacterium]|nr:nitric oxide synthase [bacterium]